MLYLCQGIHVQEKMFFHLKAVHQVGQQEEWGSILCYVADVIDLLIILKCGHAGPREGGVLLLPCSFFLLRV